MATRCLANKQLELGDKHWHVQCHCLDYLGNGGFACTVPTNSMLHCWAKESLLSTIVAGPMFLLSARMTDAMVCSANLQEEKIVIAKQDYKGNKKAAVLPLQKGKLYWVQQHSELEGGWMKGRDCEGNQGLFLQVFTHTQQVQICAWQMHAHFTVTVIANTCFRG